MAWAIRADRDALPPLSAPLDQPNVTDYASTPGPRILPDEGLIAAVMLTGDNVHTAEAIARDVGIDEARGNLLPEDKLLVLEGLLVGVRAAVPDTPALGRVVGLVAPHAGPNPTVRESPMRS